MTNDNIHGTALRYACPRFVLECRCRTRQLRSRAFRHFCVRSNLYALYTSTDVFSNRFLRKIKPAERFRTFRTRDCHIRRREIKLRDTWLTLGKFFGPIVLWSATQTVEFNWNNRHGVVRYDRSLRGWLTTEVIIVVRTERERERKRFIGSVRLPSLPTSA